MKLLTSNLLTAFLAIVGCVLLSACHDEASPRAETEAISYTFTIDNKGDYPVELHLKVYQAPLLKIGEFYQNVQQLEEASLVADLKWKLNARAEEKFDEVGVKGEIKLSLSSQLDMVSFDFKLNIEHLEKLNLRQQDYMEFNREYFYELGNDEHVYVCVYEVKKLGWKVGAERKEIPVPEKKYFPPREAKLAPMIVPEMSRNLAKRKTEAAKVRLRKYSLAGMDATFLVNHQFQQLDADAMSKLSKSMGVRSSDKVIDLRPLFKKVITSEDQWVYCNETRGEILALADSYLDASLRCYFYQRKEPSRAGDLRLTAQWLLIDVRASQNITDLEALVRQGGVKRVCGVSKMMQSYDQFAFGLGSTRVELEIILGDKSRYADVKIVAHAAGNRASENTASILLSRPYLIPCGLTIEGEKHLKSVLMLKADLLDNDGNVIKVAPPFDFVNYKPKFSMIDGLGDPFNDDSQREIVFAWLQVPAEFEELISPIPDVKDPFRADIENTPDSFLVTTPKHPYFDPSDIVIDVSRIFLKSGIPQYRGDCILFNLTKEELFVVGGKDNLELIEHLTSWGEHRPMAHRTIVTLYEVDSRNALDEAWSAKLIALSNPQVIASCGVLSRSGEESVIHSGVSQIKLESLSGDDGYQIDQSYDIEIKTKQHKINKKLKIQTKDGASSIVEIENNGTRSIVMLLEVAQDNMRYTTFSKSEPMLWQPDP